MPSELERFQTAVKENNDKLAVNILQSFPEILDQDAGNGLSGFLFIAYSQKKLLLEKAIELKTKFNFHDAIIAGRIEQIKSDIHEQPDLVHSFSSDGFTSIGLATFFDQEEIAILLLDKGADPAVKADNPTSVNALHAAVAKSNIELCKKFLEKGIDVNICQMQNISPLHSAVHRNNLEIVKLLLKYGADAHFKNDNGDNAFTIAEKETNFKMTQLLKDS